MELIDVLDENGNKIGVVKQKVFMGNVISKYTII